MAGVAEMHTGNRCHGRPARSIGGSSHRYGRGRIVLPTDFDTDTEVRHRFDTDRKA